MGSIGRRVTTGIALRDILFDHAFRHAKLFSDLCVRDAIHAREQEGAPRPFGKCAQLSKDNIQLANGCYDTFGAGCAGARHQRRVRFQKCPLDLRATSLIDQQPAGDCGEVGSHIPRRGGIPLLDQAAERVLRNIRRSFGTARVSTQPPLQPIAVTAVQPIKVNGGGAGYGQGLLSNKGSRVEIVS